MPLSELVQALEVIAPLRDAAPWDNVGLLVGDPAADVSRVLLAIDYTVEVAAEARAERCEAVIAYHPPIFGKLDRVVRGATDASRPGALVYDAIRSGIAIYSPHTALDVADGGTNDVLADALGMKERAPLSRTESKDADYKLVFFVPLEGAERVSRAVFDAGAGRIGSYSSCSFRSPGTGTFFGEEGATPVVGERGRLEQVEELRVETVVPIARVAAVLAALRASHPYEEPAFDLVRVAAPPGKGMGRIGVVEEITRAALVVRIKAALGVERVLVAGPTEGSASRVAACAGSCGDLVFEALRGKADLYLTGELRHHDALRAAAEGMTVVCALHSASERGVLPHLAARLSRALPRMAFVISRADRDPFRFV